MAERRREGKEHGARQSATGAGGKRGTTFQCLSAAGVDLEPHTDLRREILARSLQAAIDDPRPSIPAEEVFKELRELRASSLEPAVWEK